MNKLDTAIMQSKQSKPYYHKIILDLLVQLTTRGKYRSLRAFKQSGDKLTAEQKETLRRYTCLLYTSSMTKGYLRKKKRK